MSGTSQLARLAARKQLLIAESELNRHLLANDIHRLRSFFGHAGKLASVGGLAAPTLLWIARLVIGWHRPRGDGFKGLLGSLLKGWELVSALEPVWKKFSARVNRTAAD